MYLLWLMAVDNDMIPEAVAKVPKAVEVVVVVVVVGEAKLVMKYGVADEEAMIQLVEQ